MCASNELLYSANQLGGVPIIDAPTSWKYFAWKLEYDAAHGENAASKHLHVVKGLQAVAEHEMKWLGNIPVDALIEIRKQGALEEIRGILGNGIAELVASDRENFNRTSDRVFDNIHHAFDAHQANIKELAAKGWKFAGHDIGAWVVVGSLAAVAAATGTVGPALAALVADKALNPAKPQEVVRKARELVKQRRDLNLSAVGLLFQCQKKAARSA
jgi:hypothetical protein